MSMVSVDVNQLNRAIIKVGSRASLASHLGKGASYISYVIESGEMEEELAEKIAIDYNIDVIMGDTRVLGTEKVSKTEEKSSGNPKYDLERFFKSCCERDDPKAEALFSDLYVTYVLFQIKNKQKYISRTPFERTLRLGYGFESESRIVYEPFPYMNKRETESGNFQPNKRTVIKGITLKMQGIIDVINVFYGWKANCCEKYDGDSDISELLESFNRYVGDHSNIKYELFTTMLSFLGFSLKTQGNTHKSVRCHGIKLQDDPKKKAVVDDLYGLKKDALILGEVNPTPQEASVMEQLLAEQRRTNDLLEELISIWK